MRDEIEALERRLLEPEVRANAAALAELLDEQFREFGQSGRVYDRAAILAHLTAESGQTRFQLESFELQAVGTDHMLATYVAVRKADEHAPEARSLRSSIWRRTENRWRLLFHQGTALDPMRG